MWADWVEAAKTSGYQSPRLADHAPRRHDRRLRRRHAMAEQHQRQPSAEPDPRRQARCNRDGRFPPRPVGGHSADDRRGGVMHVVPSRRTRRLSRSLTAVGTATLIAASLAAPAHEDDVLGWTKCNPNNAGPWCEVGAAIKPFGGNRASSTARRPVTRAAVAQQRHDFTGQVAPCFDPDQGGSAATGARACTTGRCRRPLRSRRRWAGRAKDPAASTTSCAATRRSA
jgi:hypothetical protein